MCRRRGSLVASRVFAMLLVTLVPLRTVSAQTTYQTALERSLAAHAAGDQAVARVFMEQAHALEPSARTFRGLGVIAYAEGRKVDAIVHLEAALASTVRALTPELRSAVQELLARTFREVARVRLAVEPAQSEVSVDGAAATWHAPGELLVSAGVHQLTVRAVGRLPYILDLSLAPGASEAVHVLLAEQPSATASVLAPTADTASVPAVENLTEGPSASAQSAPVPRADEPGGLPWWRPPVRNGVLIGGGLLALGSVALWGTAARRFGVLRDHCLAQAAGGCEPSEAKRLLESSHVTAYERAALTTSVLAGVSLMGALALTLWQQNGRDETPLAVRVSTTEASLQGSF